MNQPHNEYLLRRQYPDSSRLRARQELHARFGTNPQGFFRWVFDQFNLPPEARILELGCGFGGLWKANLERLPEGWSMPLTDLSEGMLRDARENLRGSGLRIAFAIADAQETPFPERSFDAVVANHMLYHVPSVQRAASEIARVLRPGGRLYAATNGLSHMREAQELTELLAEPELRREPVATGADRFGLENGPEQLAPWFGRVEVRRYPESLRVTEAAPLVAYILSTRRADEILDPLPQDEAERRVRDLAGLLESRIAAEGAIHITKDSGMLVAWQEDSGRP